MQKRVLIRAEITDLLARALTLCDEHEVGIQAAPHLDLALHFMQREHGVHAHAQSAAVTLRS